jgi:pimeloyl-ACP methyl ester carboxylesterase
VVAHSFGCGATIWALAHGLDVPRVVLIASPVPHRGPPREGRSLEQWEKKQLDDGEDPEVVTRALAILTARPPVQENREYSVESVLPTLTAKALVVHSMDDEACPVANSQALADLWPGTELLVLDNLGHRLIAQEPDVVQRIFEFVDGIS